MQAYTVSHKTSGKQFYVLAPSSSEAIERVSLNLEDAEGKAAWMAEPDARYSPCKGVVLDGSGKPVAPLEG